VPDFSNRREQLALVRQALLEGARAVAAGAACGSRRNAGMSVSFFASRTAGADPRPGPSAWRYTRGPARGESPVRASMLIATRS